VILGEWKAASSKTIRTLKYSVLITIVGIAVLMSSVAVPSANQKLADYIYKGTY